MLNIVIPMAGLGSRFSQAGYALPKPLIDVAGVPMIKVVTSNLTPKGDHRFIFVCQNEHIAKYDLESKLKTYAKNVVVIGLDGVTEGQVCTVLAAREYINNDQPLMTGNSDQYIDFDINYYIEAFDKSGADGFIMTMESSDPKWSYVEMGDDGRVVRTAEKEVISNNATVGIYNFRRGSDLVKYAELMIKKNIRVKNEFYTCPVYNFLIDAGMDIRAMSIGQEAGGMYGLGTPSDLECFLAHPISRRIPRGK